MSINTTANKQTNNKTQSTASAMPVGSSDVLQRCQLRAAPTACCWKQVPVIASSCSATPEHKMCYSTSLLLVRSAAYPDNGIPRRYLQDNDHGGPSFGQQEEKHWRKLKCGGVHWRERFSQHFPNSCMISQNWVRSAVVILLKAGRESRAPLTWPELCKSDRSVMEFSVAEQIICNLWLQTPKGQKKNHCWKLLSECDRYKPLSSFYILQWSMSLLYLHMQSSLDKIMLQVWAKFHSRPKRSSMKKTL